MIIETEGKIRNLYMHMYNVKDRHTPLNHIWTLTGPNFENKVEVLNSQKLQGPEKPSAGSVAYPDNMHRPQDESL